MRACSPRLRSVPRDDFEPSPVEQSAPEVVPEGDPAIGGNEIAPVVQADGGRGPGIVEREDPRGDPGAVEAERDGVGAQRGGQQPEGVQGLSARQREDPDGGRAGDGDGPPEKSSKEPH